MPHAETDNTPTTSTMGEKLTNGEKPHSLFISHLTSYPLVSDSLSIYLENPYGAKSVNLFNNAYKSFITPVEPYLKTPYSYVAPYVQKADSLGDKGLSEVDTRFPIVKEETSTLKEKVKTLPVVDYVWKTFEDQDKIHNNGQKGVVPFAKSVVGTELKIAADSVRYFVSFFVAKKEEVKQISQQKLNELNEKTQT